MRIEIEGAHGRRSIQGESLTITAQGIVSKDTFIAEFALMHGQLMLVTHDEGKPLGWIQATDRKD